MCGQLKKKSREVTQSHEHPVVGNWPQISFFCLGHLSVAQLTADSTLARQQEEKLSENIELF